MRCPAASSSSHDRFVGQLDGVLRGGHQPCTDQQADDVVAVAVATEGPGGHPRTHRFTIGRRRDEPQHHRTQLGTLLDGQALVQPVGGTGDGTTDLPGRPVPLDRQHAAIAPLPGLRQGVGQQRQRPRLAFTVAHQEIDQPRFEAQPGSFRRAFDGVAERLPAERLDQVQTTFGEGGEVVVDGEGGDVVGTHGDDHRSRLGRVASEASTQRPRPLGAGLVEREQLLELVDDQHRAAFRR
jgi:hypothetical protein